MDNKVSEVVSEKSFENNTRDVIAAYFLDRRDALCRELASVEKQLAALGKPLRNPKVKPTSKSTQDT